MHRRGLRSTRSLLSHNHRLVSMVEQFVLLCYATPYTNGQIYSINLCAVQKRWGVKVTVLAVGRSTVSYQEVSIQIECAMERDSGFIRDEAYYSRVSG